MPRSTTRRPDSDVTPQLADMSSGKSAERTCTCNHGSSTDKAAMMSVISLTVSASNSGLSSSTMPLTSACFFANLPAPLSTPAESRFSSERPGAFASELMGRSDIAASPASRGTSSGSLLSPPREDCEKSSCSLGAVSSSAGDSLSCSGWGVDRPNRLRCPLPSRSAPCYPAEPRHPPRSVCLRRVQANPAPWTTHPPQPARARRPGAAPTASLPNRRCSSGPRRPVRRSPARTEVARRW